MGYIGLLRVGFPVNRAWARGPKARSAKLLRVNTLDPKPTMNP